MEQTKGPQAEPVEARTPTPRTRIVERALALGFDAIGFAPAHLGPEAGERLRAFLAAGHHGSMGWMADTADRRAHPRALWAQARTAICLAVNYGPDFDPLESLAHPDRATVSCYAQGRDYHDPIKGRLKQLAGFVAGRIGAQVKVFVDTAPLMEKPLAQAAGLGWQGKHTNLVSRAFGSWTFLGTILTDLEIPPDAPEGDRCGTCRACLDACPTDAFPAPYRLDARRCVSYLTIEHAGPVDPDLRAKLGNRIYGCDDCLAVCPWNKFARAHQEPAFAPRAGLTAPRLADLAALDDAGFRALFAGSPVKRIGRNRFVRNVLYAIGNSGDPALAPVAARLADDPDAVVADAARWAIDALGRTGQGGTGQDGVDPRA